MKRAFTLIELLVVIAIIAILAAILFPVFAQAKAAAKKTQSLSNTKQSATGIIIYTADADDTAPLAYTFNQFGTMVMGPPSYQLALVPNDPRVMNTATLSQLNNSAAFWMNSAAGYIKNLDLFDTPFSKHVVVDDALITNNQAGLKKIHMSMNGLMSGYSMTAVQSPSTVPLISYGNGRESYKGQAYTNPYLRCTVAGTAANPAPPCVFNPGGMSQAGMAASTRGDTYEFSFDRASDTMWTHGEGFMVAHTDSSAKYYKAPAEGTNTRNRKLPAYIISKNARGVMIDGGYVADPARCVSATGAPGYNIFYRPDSNGSADGPVGNTGMAVPCGF